MLCLCMMGENILGGVVSDFCCLSYNNYIVFVFVFIVWLSVLFYLGSYFIMSYHPYCLQV